MRYLTGFAAATVAVAFASGAIAGEVKLPKTMAWSAYGLKSSGYAHSVAIGKALKENYGISLRVVPGKNDIAPPASQCAHRDPGVFPAVDKGIALCLGEMRLTLPIHLKIDFWSGRGRAARRCHE